MVVVVVVVVVVRGKQLRNRKTSTNWDKQSD
jgi:hypothetical protein